MVGEVHTARLQLCRTVSPRVVATSDGQGYDEKARFLSEVGESRRVSVSLGEFRWSQ